MFYSFNTGKSNYLGEKYLKKITLDDKGYLYIWTSRITRYFQIGSDVKNNNSKENTVILITNFLKNIHSLSANTKKFLCTDTSALNCLILTLLLSNDQNDWDATLTLIQYYNALSDAVVQQLKWYYDLVFKPVSLSHDNTIQSIINRHNLTLSSLMPSPISHVFQFMALAQHYLKYPQSDFTELTPFFINKPKHKLTLLATTITQGNLAIQFSHHPFINEQLDTIKQIFRVQFDVFSEELTTNKTLFNEPTDQLFLEYFINDSLQNINDIEQEEQLVGLSQIIQYHSEKTKKFYNKIQDKGFLLVEKLFTLEKYTEAYKLHNKLIQFIKGSNQTTVSARTALYCICSHLEQWLLGNVSSISFNLTEKSYITQFQESQLNFKMGSLAKNQLFNLAKQIAQYFHQTQNSTTQKQCKNYYNFFKNYLNTTQKNTIEKLFEPLQCPKNEGVKQTLPTHSISILNQSVIKEENNVSTIKIATTQPISYKRLETVIDKITSPITEKEISVTIRPHVFFNKTIPQPHIKRKQIPLELITLIDELRQEFPKSSFYLTGAAPNNLLDGKKPNDYDILAVNISLSEIQQTLAKKQIQSEHRSSKYPILYCTLTPEICIDFSMKLEYTNQDHQKLLESDFSKRDFNLNALYLKFTEKTLFPIFSFSNALEKRAQKKIISVSDTPLESFKQDPTRLFRLAKLIINYPDYTLDPHLKKAVLKLKNQWFYIFNAYQKHDKGNKFRLNHAIRKLFLRYSAEEINTAFARLGVLTLFSGNSKRLSNKACARLPKTLPKEYYYLGWSLANYLQYFAEKKKIIERPLLITYMVQTPTETQCLQFITNVLNANVTYTYIPTLNPALLELCQEFHLINNSPQFAPL